MVASRVRTPSTTSTRFGTAAWHEAAYCFTWQERIYDLLNPAPVLPQGLLAERLPGRIPPQVSKLFQGHFPSWQTPDSYAPCSSERLAVFGSA